MKSRSNLRSIKTMTELTLPMINDNLRNTINNVSINKESNQEPFRRNTIKRSNTGRTYTPNHKKKYSLGGNEQRIFNNNSILKSFLRTKSQTKKDSGSTMDASYRFLERKVYSRPTSRKNFDNIM